MVEYFIYLHIHQILIFKPIETAFSALKSWLKRYRNFTDYFDPIYLILVTLAQTTPEIAKNYFKESIYL